MAPVVDPLDGTLNESLPKREFDEFELACLFAARYPNLVDQDEIIRVLRAFEATGLEYVLIGAAAMGFHGGDRATEDLELFIRATPENIERLRTALRQAYDED